jgi:BirA family biotin operon repressor/biotin-[acetyl-CoA-carboxylase] ligase
MTTRTEILRLLADGALHSGADIGARLGISRAAVFKGVKALGESGLAIEAVAGRGYRLDAPLVPLDRKRILRYLDGAGIAPRQIEILEEVDSTNRYLLSQATATADPSASVCLAETQPRGRGRRGRGWIATAYQNLMLSMAWRFAGGPAMVSGLSLAAGVAIVRALVRYGIDGAGLKWPNDVLWRERKLAGLLADVSGEASGPCTVVLGVGINCRVSAADARRIDQPWADIYTITGKTPDRNRLAALVIDELHKMFASFAAEGLAAFRADWERWHIHSGRSVRVWQGETTFDGAVEGIDDNGALRVRGTHGETRVFYSGEVSLRARTE